MSRGPSTFRQRDVKAAIKAVADAGYQVARVEIDRDGKIVVIVARPGEDQSQGNELDKWLAEHAR